MLEIPQPTWITYIMLCEDKSLYTGITNNIEKRLHTHLMGKGARYTKSHVVKKIVYQESFSNRSEASKRELEIKALKKSQKQDLIHEYRNTFSKSH